MVFQPPAFDPSKVKVRPCQLPPFNADIWERAVSSLADVTIQDNSLSNTLKQEVFSVHDHPSVKAVVSVCQNRDVSPQTLEDDVQFHLAPYFQLQNHFNRVFKPLESGWETQEELQDKLALLHPQPLWLQGFMQQWHYPLKTGGNERTKDMNGPAALINTACRVYFGLPFEYGETQSESHSTSTSSSKRKITQSQSSSKTKSDKDVSPRKRASLAETNNSKKSQGALESQGGAGSHSSRNTRDQSYRKMLDGKIAAGFGVEDICCFGFENSCTSNAKKHAKEDREALMGVLVKSVSDARKLLQQEFRVYSLQFYRSNGFWIRGTMCLVHPHGKCFASYQLFEVEYPMVLSSPEDRSKAIVALKCLLALLFLVKDSFKQVTSLPQARALGRKNSSAQDGGPSTGGGSGGPHKKQPKPDSSDDCSGVSGASEAGKSPTHWSLPKPKKLKKKPHHLQTVAEQAAADLYEVDARPNGRCWQGSFGTVFAAESTGEPRFSVVMKVQPTGALAHAELTALRGLESVGGVVRLYDGVGVGEWVVLVLERLTMFPFTRIQGHPHLIEKFASGCSAILHGIHMAGFSHGDIKFKAFGLSTQSRCDALRWDELGGGVLKLFDFNLSGKAGEQMQSGRLPGTRGYVFRDAPACTRANGDHIGFAAVLGRLLNVAPLTFADTSFATALKAVRTAATRAKMQATQRLFHGILELLKLPSNPDVLRNVFRTNPNDRLQHEESKGSQLM